MWWCGTAFNSRNEGFGAGKDGGVTKPQKKRGNGILQLSLGVGAAGDGGAGVRAAVPPPGAHGWGGAPRAVHRARRLLLLLLLLRRRRRARVGSRRGKAVRVDRADIMIVDPGLKALGFQPFNQLKKYTSPFKVLVSDGDLHPYTSGSGAAFVQCCPPPTQRMRASLARHRIPNVVNIQKN